MDPFRSTTDPSTSGLSTTGRTTLGRLSERGRTDRAALHGVLDAGLICHLGVVIDGTPVVLPTGYGRIGETLYLHGSSANRSLAAAAGTEVCVTVTLLDGYLTADFGAWHLHLCIGDGTNRAKPDQYEPDEKHPKTNAKGGATQSVYQAHYPSALLRRAFKKDRPEAGDNRIGSHGEDRPADR
jgi:hypothetical protein